MKDKECYSIVFSSSATIYGLTNSVPISEDLKVLPINPYGIIKVAIENMLSDLFISNMNLWKICSLRYFNPFGAHPSGLTGEDPIGLPSNLFPYITHVVIRSLNLLKVFGDNWNAEDGSGVRLYSNNGSI